MMLPPHCFLFPVRLIVWDQGRACTFNGGKNTPCAQAPELQPNPTVPSLSPHTHTHTHTHTNKNKNQNNSSINLAVTLGSKVTLASGDPAICLVVAWALYAVADDLVPGKSILRKSGSVGNDALDALEISARVSAGLQAGLGALVIAWKVALRAGVVRPGDAERLVDVLLTQPIKALMG
jgi:hypothetical protein